MQGFNIVESFLGMTLLGAEWVLWLLVFLSILSIAIIIERMLFFMKIKSNFPKFISEMRESLSSENNDKAQESCENGKDLARKVAHYGLLNKSKNIHSLQGGMESIIVEERQQLDKGLVVLGTLGNNAPFIGLFGTVIGIIKAFADLASNPDGGPSVVMAGISEALVATAVGLLVAIPAVIAYNAFNRIVKKHISNAEATLKLMTTYHDGRS